MTSLAESFLEDLEELDRSSDEDEEADNAHGSNNEGNDGLSDFDSDDDEEMDTHQSNIDDVLVKIIESKGASSIGILRNSASFKKLLKEVSDALESSGGHNYHVGPLDHDPEYKLVLSCNKVVQDIDDENTATHRYIADFYAKKFNELLSLIPNKVDYVKTVLRIGNEMDMTIINFDDLLPRSLIMTLKVAGSTTSGKPLSEEDLAECNRAGEFFYLLIYLIIFSVSKNIKNIIYEFNISNLQ
jgi:U4/U6 small nuclear ribonucleoprotein PRP31